mgnify:FL=1
MEKVLRIQSDNSLVQAFKIGTTAPTQKLVDFTIPPDGVYDLEKSYVSIAIKPVLANNAEAKGLAVGGGADPRAGLTGIVPVVSGLKTQAATDESVAAPMACLVKNCQMYAQNKGMIESVRRIDTLKLAQHYLEKDDIELQRDLNQLGSIAIDKGPGLLGSYYMDKRVITEGDNIEPTGETKDFTSASRLVAREHKIYLKDLFGIGKANMYDAVRYGKTQVHLELNLDKFEMRVPNVNEATTAFASGVNMGACDTSANLPNLTLVKEITLTETFDNPEFYCPFFVGEVVLINGTSSTGGAFAQSRQVIDDIVYDETTKKITLKFRDAIYIINNGAGETFSPNVKRDAAITASVEILGAEMVLTEVVNPTNVPASLDYICYSTEEDVGNSLATINRQYKIEPNCQSLFICSCDSGQISPDRNIEYYRLAIDSIDVSGNRDIPYGRPIYHDRITRCYKNRNVALKNLEMKMFRQDRLANAMRAKELAVIAETMPITNVEKTINLELKNDANVQDLKVYKELIKTI